VAAAALLAVYVAALAAVAGRTFRRADVVSG
jgi:hypothetical protein